MLNWMMKTHGPLTQLPTLLLLTLMLLVNATDAHADSGEPTATATYVHTDPTEPAADTTHP
ncbi:hypothetical protein, partial [Pseudomonas sp.]|uniref:hypothetical protein n=1 Tax=Pseudomonas sp. TaxID=306 RepID=UPI003CC5F671